MGLIYKLEVPDVSSHLRNNRVALDVIGKVLSLPRASDLAAHSQDANHDNAASKYYQMWRSFFIFSHRINVGIMNTRIVILALEYWHLKQLTWYF